MQQKLFEIFMIQDKKKIDLFSDKAKIRSKAIYVAKQDKTKGTGLKILTSKQMLQRFPLALAQVKVGNNWENTLNEIRQIVYSLYQSKETTKKYTITWLSDTIKLNPNIKTDTIFINSEK